jgi:hypothetical protein
MDKDIIFQVPATVKKVETMSHKSLKVILHTQENITAEETKRLMDLHEVLGWFTIVHRKNDGKIKPEDIVDLPILHETDVKKKTPSQRLHDVLFVLFTKTGGKKEDFDIWRLRKMDQIIEHYRSKIPQD